MTKKNFFEIIYCRAWFCVPNTKQILQTLTAQKRKTNGDYMKIKITADSTCDLSQELCQKYGITLFPLTVNLGDESYLDGVTINPEMIYDFVQKTKTLPKTSAVNQQYYREKFAEILQSGYDAIVHFTISSEMSACYQNALATSKEFDNVFVVDSRTLSTGIGLLAIYASELAQKGELSAKEIAEKAQARAKHSQTSFIVDKLDYLYRGGRCNAVAFLGANLLKIKPSIVVKNGVMGVDKKYIGKLEKTALKYVKDIIETYNTPDTTRIFITHTKIDEAIVESIKTYLKENTAFKEILETTAGSTITSHCGSHTIGILFLNDGNSK